MCVSQSSSCRKTNVSRKSSPSKENSTSNKCNCNNESNSSQRCKKLIHLHERLFRIQKFTQKMQDSQQIQHYQNCVIRDISKLNRLKNSVKHQKTVKNTRKQCETETLLVSRCCHKHLTFIYTTLHNILHQDFYPSW